MFLVCVPVKTPTNHWKDSFEPFDLVHVRVPLLLTRTPKTETKTNNPAMCPGAGLGKSKTEPVPTLQGVGKTVPRDTSPGKTRRQVLDLGVCTC